MKTAFSPLHSGQSDMYRTDYVYYSSAPNRGRIRQVIQSADVAGGTRPVTRYTWNAAGRMTSMTDPVGRTTSYAYDGLGRVVQTTYNDGSTEQVAYLPGTDAGQVQATKDRNNVVTVNTWDQRARLVQSVTAAAIDANILDGNAMDQVISDPTQQRITTRQFYDGTNLLRYQTVDGRTTEYIRDPMGRAVQTRRRPNASTTLDTYQQFDGYRPLFTTDWLGRRTFNGYDTEGRVVRTITETIPGGCPLDSTTVNNQQVLDLNRDSDPSNARYLITERVYDVADQMTGSIDPRGIVSSTQYDSRGRATMQTSAVGTPVQTQSETVYDVSSNVVGQRGPRYFDPSDTQAYQLASTSYTYNGRELQSGMTQVLNATQAATSSTAYAPDGRTIRQTDARGFDWETDWHTCCGRLLGSRDPAGHGNFSNTDYRGSVTHSIAVQDYDSHISSHDPIDAKTMSEATVRIDALGRQVATCQWLVPRGVVDPNNVPIAGIDADGNGAIDAPLSDGLPSLTFYDSNLVDGFGLDSAAGMAIAQLGSTATQNVSISGLLAQLSADAGISFNAGSAGSAVLSMNAENELSVAISDGMGRTVMVAGVEKNAGSAALAAVTWSYSTYDHSFDANSGGGGGSPQLLAEVRSIDALGHVTASRTDGGGRTWQSVDADGNVSSMQYDASGNVLQMRDANQVGYDAVYDQLDRAVSQTDTHGDSTSTTYNDAGAVLTQTDARGNVSRYVYDAAGRSTKMIDRLGAETDYLYDLASNLLSVTDAENQTTSYVYDDRGLKTSTTYPDHVAGSVPGDDDYGIQTTIYDALGRAQHRQNPRANWWRSSVYDLAGRMTGRQYRTGSQGYSGNISYQDAFVYDDASRLLSATEGRYNIVTDCSYDSIGRKDSESLMIDGQTYTTGYSRDARNQLTRVTYPSGHTVDYDYTDRRLLDRVKWNGTQLEDRTYDAGGRLTGIDRAFTDESRSYESGSNRLAWLNNTGVGRLDYAWDANDNKLSETWNGAMAPWSFTTQKQGASQFADGYDAEDRFRRFNRPSQPQGQSQEIFLDRSAIGNISDVQTDTVSELRGYDPAHELVSIGSSTQTFDANGSLRQTQTGQLLNYDHNDRMFESTIGQTQTAYQYDALGRRVKLVSNNTGAATIYVCSGTGGGQNCIAEYNTGAAPASPAQEYVYGTGIDSLIMISRNNDSQHLLATRNQQWSVIALVNLANGSVQERYTYDHFGARTILAPNGLTIRSTSSFNNPYGYTSRRHDNESGLMYFRARYYDPSTGEFTSRDPLGYVDGMSLYRGYLSQSGVDPFGLCDEGDLCWPWQKGASLNPFRAIRTYFIRADQTAGQVGTLVCGSGWVDHSCASGVRMVLAGDRGAIDGLCVVANHATFGHAHAERAKRAQQQALDTGDWVTQVGFGCGKVGVESGYLAAGTGLIGLGAKTRCGVATVRFIEGSRRTQVALKGSGVLLGAWVLKRSSCESVSAFREGNFSDGVLHAGRSALAIGGLREAICPQTPFIRAFCGRAPKSLTNGTADALSGANLNRHLSQLEKYGKGGFRQLENGRFRYYDNLTPASKPGELAGARLVREWDPATGGTRTWYEVLDHSGNVRSVAPKPPTNPLNHHIFDENGVYQGRR